MLSAVVLVPAPEARKWVITGLTLAERARRVCIRAGIAPERVHLCDTANDLGALTIDEDLLVVDAREQLVAAPLLEPLELSKPGSRLAVDDAGELAGALRVDVASAAEVLRQLATGWQRGLAAVTLPAERVTVGRRARCRCVTPEDARAATAWQFELVHKPMDAFMTRKFWRPIARPFTKIFLRLPFTPNMISIGTMLLGIAGCVVAAGPTYLQHLIGMAMLFVSAIGDNLDGEVARLRLESSKIGAWLDAIGDDVARIATLLGVGLHVAWLHPTLPITAITMGALACTLLMMGLIYWYCIFVIHSSNNQDYTKVMGVGPGVGDKKTFIDTVGNVAAQVVRRDFIDVFVFFTAIIGLPGISFVGLSAGAVIGLIVILPVHFKIVKNRREERAAA